MILNVVLQYKTCMCDNVMSHLGTVATGIAFFPDFLRP